MQAKKVTAVQILRGSAHPNVPVRALGVNLAKGTIYSGSHCGTIAEFDWNKAWEQTATVPCECEVKALLVEPPFLICGLNSGVVRVWNLQAGTQPQDLLLHRGPVLALASGSGLLFTGGELDPQHVLGVWRLDAATNQFVQAGALQHPGSIKCLLSFDSLLFAGGFDGHVRVWDVTTAQPVRQLEGHTECVMAMIQTEIAGKNYLISGSLDASIIAWDPSALKTGGELILKNHTPIQPNQGVLSLCCFQGRTEMLLVSSHNDQTLKMLSLPGFERRGVLRDHTSSVMVMAPGPPNTFFSADEGGTIAAWQDESEDS